MAAPGPTAADVKAEVEAARKPVRITVRTEGGWAKGDVASIHIKRVKDHPDWDLATRWGKKVVEPRELPEDCLRARGAQPGTACDHEWVTCWPWGGEVEFSSPDLEIYAVMRAEHNFAKWGWTKIASKIGRNGIDSLFRKNNNFIICESKSGGAPRAVADYVRYVASNSESKGQPTDSRGSRKAAAPVASRLFQGSGGIKARGEMLHPDATTDKKIREMTAAWVMSAIKRLLTCSGDLRANGEELVAAWKRGMVFRYFNFFASDPLFVLPGIYRIRSARASECTAGLTDITTEDRVFDWPDGGARLEAEVLCLDFCERFLELEAENEAEVKLASSATGRRR